MNQFNEKSDQDLSDALRAKLKSYPDFPKPGINFLDVFSLYADLEGSQILNEVFIRKGRSVIGQIDVVVGLDARGFLMGPIIAREANVPFVPVRKSGKLPGLTVGTAYSLEYGEASVEIQKDAIPEKARVLIVDDLLATGGTLNAAATLISKLGLGITVTECFVLMELAFLKGRDKITSKVSCTLSFD
ncbi:hypothetical protein TCAL_10423 [Tigriopus californicus]|uniref:Adenine phosphoribosyltransferase n=1 Tax=Tigriopus californicus TaxID=6832 RepID=A0A553P9R0_TIGCA|nr:adenine phosphoribosyltransferase-like [Tigriopus californicus]XP_059098575.1 adenine phosphoribosyltransferase-like [Tigriopus californicus]TRY74413.1 hypothetical protein TCAL_10423 [Tigriopus californicus]|eukprot:TCALIF_10423-PA protein Name:"Similar to T19B4.3 Adenine phosphoribosyltransferase (Caenorhabditis elegans)" AED:0.08 eAED:0.08 QI:98/1/1/1/0.5/0.66/3/40/187